MENILTAEEKVKELYNLINAYELCYPVIKKNIEKFEITSIRDRCYLAWTAGATYFNPDLKLSKNVFMDYFFDKGFETFNKEKMSDKSILFTFFSLGAVVSKNSFDEIKVILRDYYNIIAVGIVLIHRVKYDIIENGVRKWSIETIKKYANFDDSSTKNDIDYIKEFNRIINSKDKEKNDTKILN